MLRVKKAVGQTQNAAQCLFDRNPKGTVWKTAPLIVERLAQTPGLGFTLRLDGHCFLIPFAFAKIALTGPRSGS